MYIWKYITRQIKIKIHLQENINNDISKNILAIKELERLNNLNIIKLEKLCANDITPELIIINQHDYINKKT